MSAATHSPSGGLESELLDPVSDLIAIDMQQLRGLGLIATSTLECLCEKLPLDFLETDPVRWELKLCWLSPCA